MVSAQTGQMDAGQGYRGDGDHMVRADGYVKEFTRHSNDVLLNLNELRHRSILTDTTLVVGSVQLRAHCAVLVACRLVDRSSFWTLEIFCYFFFFKFIFFFAAGSSTPCTRGICCVRGVVAVWSSSSPCLSQTPWIHLVSPCCLTSCTLHVSL